MGLNLSRNRARFISIITLICFVLSSTASYAQMAVVLPAPGTMMALSPPFCPPVLKGVKVYPDDPFRFDFILDKGDIDQPDAAVQDESNRLIKYFLASLTIPENDLWVNLSPYEKDRIVPDAFGQTEMGRDLLAQDYLLKQITASVVYPEGEVGKAFWTKVYAQAQQRYGTTGIPVDTFNKVWIIPEKAVVYENAKAGTSYVVESRLKVMLEQDYLALRNNADGPVRDGQESANALGSQMIREIVIPQLTKEVNENKNFAPLRQVYHSLILATWYKKKIQDSLLSKVYTDKRKVAGVEPLAFFGKNSRDAEYIYRQYLQAFKKGVYSLIKEEPDPLTGELIPRKYFSGGAVFNAKVMGDAWQSAATVPDGIVSSGRKASIIEMRVDKAMKAPVGSVEQWEKDGFGKIFLPINLPEELKNSGLSQEQIDLIQKQSAGVLTVYDAIDRKEELTTRGGYALGISGDFDFQPTQIMSEALGVTYFIDAYEDHLGQAVQPKTSEFMSAVMDADKPVFFFLPDDMFQPRETKVTVEEFEWLLQRPEKMKKVYFIFGVSHALAQKQLIMQRVREMHKKLPQRSSDQVYRDSAKEVALLYVNYRSLLRAPDNLPSQKWEQERPEVARFLKEVFSLVSDPGYWDREKYFPLIKLPPSMEARRKALGELLTQKGQPKFVSYLTTKARQDGALAKSLEKEGAASYLGMVMFDFKHPDSVRGLFFGVKGFFENYPEHLAWRGGVYLSDIVSIVGDGNDYIFGEGESYIQSKIDNQGYIDMSGQHIDDQANIHGAIDLSLNTQGLKEMAVEMVGGSSMKMTGEQRDMLKSELVEIAITYIWLGRLLDGTKNINFSSDKASLSGEQDQAKREATGGVDLTPANMKVQTQGGEGEIKFHLDPVQWQQLQNAAGFAPVIMSIRPMTDLKLFLGDL